MSRKMPLCSVTNCANGDPSTVDSGVFYYLPGNQEIQRANKWIDIHKEHGEAPASGKVLICSNHFQQYDCEADSTKLKMDAIPLVCGYPPRQPKSDFNTVTLQEGAPPKMLKVTNATLTCNTKKSEEHKADKIINDEILSQKYIILSNTVVPDKNGVGSQFSIPMKVQDNSNLPKLKILSVLSSNIGSSIGTKISYLNNEKRSLPQNRSVHMEKNVPFLLAHSITNTNPSVSRVIKEEPLGPQQSKVQNDDLETEMPSSSSNSRLKDYKMDEDCDIKQEILDIKSEASLEDELTEDDIMEKHYSRQFKNLFRGAKIKKLKLLKQSLLEEREKLRKQEQEVDLELKKLRKEVQRKKVERQNCPEQEIEVLKKCFSMAQIRLLTGQNKSRWSLDDLAMAYTISSLSSREFYIYLRTNLKYPLPAVSNINRCYKSKYRTKK